MEHKQFVPIMCFDGLLTVAPPYSKAKLRPTMAKEKFIEAVPAPGPRPLSLVTGYLHLSFKTWVI